MPYLTDENFGVFTNSDTGEVFATFDQLALMCGVTTWTLGYYFPKYNGLKYTLDEVPTEYGLVERDIYNEQTIEKTLWFMFDKGKAGAKETIKQTHGVGIKTYIHNLTGY